MNTGDGCPLALLYPPSQVAGLRERMTAYTRATAALCQLMAEKPGKPVDVPKKADALFKVFACTLQRDVRRRDPCDRPRTPPRSRPF